MSNVFQSVAPSAASEPQTPTAITEPQPVEAKSGEEVAKEAPRYTRQELDSFIEERVGKLTRQHKKELEAIQSEYAEKGKKSADDDLKSQLAKAESHNKTLAEQMTKFRTASAREQLLTALFSQNAVDPDVVANDILFRGDVTIDDMGELSVKHPSMRINEYVKDYLAERKGLVKNTIAGGTGSQGPSQPVVAGMSRLEELKRKFEQPHAANPFKRT